MHAQLDYTLISIAEALEALHKAVVPDAQSWGIAEAQKKHAVLQHLQKQGITDAQIEFKPGPSTEKKGTKNMRITLGNAEPVILPMDASSKHWKQALNERFSVRKPHNPPR